MLLANFSKVSKDFGGNSVFRDIDLEIMEGERIGLVGENGGGKSTLFKLLAGKEDPTSGVISRRRNLTTGYLFQEADPDQSSKTIFEAVSEVTQELVDLPGILGELEARMADPAVAADPDELTRVLQEYGRAQERFEALGGYTNEHKVEAVLHGLGFGPAWYDVEVGSLSGGEKKLVNLARILIRMPDLLLLDEPDNHLDLEAKAWLEQYIQSYPGTVLIISHDRQLLDRAVKKIFELEDGRISSYAGNYSYYFEERRRRLQKQYELYTLQQDEIKRLEGVWRQYQGWSKVNDKFATKAEDTLKRIERIKKDAVNKPILMRDKIKVNLDADRSGKKVLEIQGLSKAYDGRVLFRAKHVAHGKVEADDAVACIFRHRQQRRAADEFAPGQRRGHARLVLVNRRPAARAVGQRDVERLVGRVAHDEQQPAQQLRSEPAVGIRDRVFAAAAQGSQDRSVAAAVHRRAA